MEYFKNMSGNGSAQDCCPQCLGYMLYPVHSSPGQGTFTWGMQLRYYKKLHATENWAKGNMLMAFSDLKN